MRRLLLLALIAACDPVTVRHTPDGMTSDGAPDAPTHGMVRVQVYDPNNTGAVVAGVPVVFVEADDTQVGHPTTDSQGYASADVKPGASATVVVTTQGSTQMTTLFGLKPGDDIILGSRRVPPTDAGNFTVSFATYSGATQYYVYGPCGGTNTTTSPVTLPMQSDCKLDSMNLTVVAYDANSNPIAYLTKTSVTFAAGGSTAVTGSYQGISNFTASYTNISPIVTNVSINRQMPDGYGPSNGTSGAPTSGGYTTSFPAVQGASAVVQSEFDNNAIGGQQMINEVIQGNALTHGMDVGAKILPWLGKPMLDATNHKITVPVDNTGTSGDMPDVFIAQTGYARVINQVNQRYAWLVISATPGDITLPTLPPEVGDVMPKMGDTINSTLALMLESDAFTGYDTIRQDVYLTINGVTEALHPTSGTTRESVNFSGGF